MKIAIPKMRWLPIFGERVHVRALAEIGRNCPGGAAIIHVNSEPKANLSNHLNDKFWTSK
jgi:hypothetical protein